MSTSRRSFLRFAGIAGMGLAHCSFRQAGAHAQDTANVNNKVAVGRAIATLEDGGTLATPFWRIESGKEGPSLLLLAAQHGNEIHGAEVARRMKDVCSRQLIAGSVWLVPMANLPAIRVRRHSVDLGPEQPGRFSQGHNMQQTWPGNPEGNNTQRIAFAIDQAVVRHCSHAVDMHCWNQFWAAETLAVTGHASSELMGNVTTTRFISYRPVRPPAEKPVSFSHMMHQRGAGAIVMELSGQFQMRQRQVQIGLDSMLNIAKALGMIAGEPERIKGPRVERKKETSHEVLAPAAGIFMPATQNGSNLTLVPGDFVEEGQPLGHILSETDLATVPVVAPVAGYLWQLNACHGQLCDASLPAQHPYAAEGDRLALIVRS